MDLFLVNFVPLTGLWLTFFACYPSFRGCDGNGCGKRFRFGPCILLLLVTVVFSVATVFSNGSLEEINGRFTARSSKEKIAKQLSQSVSTLNEGADATLELEHIRQAIKTEWSDLARWRNELPESKDLKELEDRVIKLFEALRNTTPEKLSDTLLKEREKFLR